MKVVFAILFLISGVLAASESTEESTTEQYGLKWVVMGSGGIPLGALAGGNVGRESLFVCRVYYDNHLTVGKRTSNLFDLIYRTFIATGKLHPSHHACIITYERKEVKVRTYQVAVGEGVWVKSRRGQVPISAIAAGYTKNGENLYICRVLLHGNHMTPGELQHSAKGCFISYDSVELKFDEYEVLTD